jgi:NAD(P)-dependent dehydrogenase (short-subunit alcohol dehydrogenase family)
VNGVAPGPIWTPLIPQSFAPEKVEQHGQKAPLQRSGQPAEVAPIYVFLASDDARYVSGEIVGVTGGSPLV